MNEIDHICRQMAEGENPGDLARAFRDAHASGASPGEDALRAVIEAARTRYPDVRAPALDFVRYIAERVSDPGLLNELRPAELYLAFASTRGDQRALEIVRDRYLARLPPVLARIHPSPAFADEVIQLVSERLLVARPGTPPRIAEYRGIGSLHGWVRMTALRIALRVRDRRNVELDANGPAPSPDTVALTPEMEYLKRRYRPQFEMAFRDALGALPSRARSVLRHHYVQGQSIDVIARRYRVHRSTAARWIASARQLLVTETRRRVREILHIPERELDSLMDLVASRIDVSLNQLASENAHRDDSRHR